MHTRPSRWAVTTLLFVFVTLALIASGSPTAEAQTLNPGNPTCADLGYAHELKIDPPTLGTYPIGLGSVTWWYSAGDYQVDWTSTFGIDAVIMKGGQAGANIYSYNPEATSGSGLVTPNNPSGGPAALSHISFCYDYEVQVSKNAQTSYTHTYTWGITKDYDASYSKFIGDPAWTHNYLVNVVRYEADSNFIVSGKIWITNPDPTYTATISAVVDDAGGISAGVSCPSSSLAPGATMECTYSAGPLTANGFGGTNTATVTTSGWVGGGSGTAAIDFSTATVTYVGYSAVNVTDTNGQSWSASGSASWAYTRDFSCPANPTQYTNGVYTAPPFVNKATITETGQSDSATVNLTCYAPVVSKDAAAHWLRDIDWTITKTATPPSADRFAGESATYDYTVKVTKSETNTYVVSGKVYISNPAGSPGSMTVSVVDMLDSVTAATVDCGGGASSVVVAPGATASCAYTGTLAAKIDGTNTATGTFKGIGFVANAGYAFGGPEYVPGSEPETINVSDTYGGALGEFSTSGEVSYSRTESCSTDPSSYTDGFYTQNFDNRATIEETGEYDDERVTLNCYAPVVSKNATAEWTKKYDWTITKSAVPAEHTGFAGDSFSSAYDVVVDQTITEYGYKAYGTISVTNPDGSPGPITVDVADAVNGTAAVVDCDSTEPGGQTSLTVASGGTGACSYSVDLPDNTDGVNTATVTFNSIYFSALADVRFGDPIIEGYPTINVTDYFDGDLEGEALGSASGDLTFEYSRDFECSSAQADYTDGVDVDLYANTAIIDQTEQEDDAEVTVTCYAPVVTKTADESFTRSYEWDIDKSGDQTELTLSTGQTFLVNYDVTVSATPSDSGWAVSGTVTLSNPAPMEMTLESVTDSVSPDIAATVDCGDSLVVPAADVDGPGVLTCTYSADLPDALARVNTATVTLNSIGFTGAEDVLFGDPTTEIDECITVSDDRYGALGTVCASNLPKTFEYTRDIGPYAECGEYTFLNVASFVTNDTSTADSDDHTVAVDVPCGGCTLTQGYWKTHSIYGPARWPDETWNLIGGPDAAFYLSGQTYLEVMWTPPQGNAYYNLATQYIAAKLNILNEASSTPAVDAALASAEELFSTKTPEQVALLKGKAANDVRQWAATLDQYNNGYIGPGHCSEDFSSAP